MKKSPSFARGDFLTGAKISSDTDLMVFYIVLTLERLQRARNNAGKVVGHATRYTSPKPQLDQYYPSMKNYKIVKYHRIPTKILIYNIITHWLSIKLPVGYYKSFTRCQSYFTTLARNHSLDARHDSIL